ncbi:MAG: sedoheptulokinase [Lachnospirales bacterium]
MNVIGIDIGTTSICIVEYNTKSNKIINSFSESNNFISNSFTQSPNEIIKKVKKLLNKLTVNKNTILGIGVASQMHGILYVDEAGDAVSELYTWKVEYANLGYRSSTYSGWLSNKTGYKIYSGYGTATHFYLCENNLINKSAKKIVTIGDYVVMKLCGIKKPKITSTLAASLGGFNIETMNFDFDKLKLAEVHTDFYPAVTNLSDTAGVYKDIPILWSIGDNQASFFSSVEENVNKININVGTGSQVSICGKNLYLNNNIEIRPYFKDKYLYVQASINGGKVYEKLAEFIGEAIDLFTEQNIDISNIYKTIDALENDIEDTSLNIEPTLYGKRNSKDAFGKIEYLSESNFHIKDFIKAYIAGMAEELFNMYNKFPEELKDNKHEIVLSGNGTRNNKLLRGEISKRFNLKAELADIQEEAAIGAAKIFMIMIDKS